MIHSKPHPNKPLFTDEKEQEMFLSLFENRDEDYYLDIVRLLYCCGATIEYTAEATNYSKRHIERLKVSLLKIALKRAIKQLIKRGESNA